jgi:hypothetical protein
MNLFGTSKKPAGLLDLSEVDSKVKQLDSAIKTLIAEAKRQADFSEVLVHTRTFAGQLANRLKNTPFIKRDVSDFAFHFSDAITAFESACKHRLFDNTRQMKDQFNTAVLSNYNKLIEGLNDEFKRAGQKLDLKVLEKL